MTTRVVFDTTALSHFARAGQLPILRELTRGYISCTTPEVRAEILAGVPEHPDLADVLVSGWIETVEIDDVAVLASFAAYKTELGGGTRRNIGEAAVLAWARAHDAVAIIDDRAALRIAQRDGIVAHGSLWLVVHGIRSGVLRRQDAERLVDELRATDMRLPIDGAGLFSWAYEEGLLP